MKKISVIIVTYNSSKIILDCLDSIFKYNDIGTDLEVIVVDNDSLDTESMFSRISAKYEDNVILIKNSKNGGYGLGNNVGIKASTGQYIMIMNPDVRLVEAVFVKHLLLFNDRNVALIGMQQMETCKKRGYSFGPVRISLYYNLFLKWSHILNIFNSNKLYIAGACFMINKETIIKAGMFDENIFLYGEERDLHCRVKSLSRFIKIKYDSSMQYLHLKGDHGISISILQDQFKSYVYWCQKVNYNATKGGYKFIRMLKRRRCKAFFRKDRSNYKLYTEALQKLDLKLG